MSNPPGPQCAHLQVRSAPVEHDDGSFTEHWECSLCSAPFCRQRTFDELLEASSLGAPEVKAMAARSNPDDVARVLKRVQDIERGPERAAIADAVLDLQWDWFGTEEDVEAERLIDFNRLTDLADRIRSGHYAPTGEGKSE